MPDTFEHGYALLIGVGDSAYPRWSLPVTVKDARMMRAVLTDPELCAYLDDDDHVRLLHDGAATGQAILDGLAWFRARAAADAEATAIVYYSGHGWVDKSTGGYYLIPHDVEPVDVPGSALPAPAFARAIHDIPARRLLVLLDCCHAEGMATAKDGPSIRLPAGFSESAMPKGLVDDLKQGQGRAVFLSSRGAQRSWVRPDGTMSVYTYHLIEALQGAANKPGEALVRLSNLMNLLGQAVPASARRWCQAEQTPFFDTATEDFPVALLRGGKGLPAGGWAAVREQAQDTIQHLVQVTVAMEERSVAIGGNVRRSPIVTGDRNVIGAEARAPVTTGDGSRAIQAQTYVERLEIRGKVAPAKEEPALEHYLHNLRRMCNALPLQALAEEEGPHQRAEVTLNRVYIALSTTLSEAPEEQEISGPSEPRPDRVPDWLRGRERRPLSALAAADQRQQLVILGDPGSGKSTFVNYLAYLLAGVRLGEEELPEGWTHGSLLPIRVVLRELVAFLPKEMELDNLSGEQRTVRLSNCVWEYLRKELASTYRAEGALRSGRRWRHSVGCAGRTGCW